MEKSTKKRVERKEEEEKSRKKRVERKEKKEKSRRKGVEKSVDRKVSKENRWTKNDEKWLNKSWKGFEMWVKEKNIDLTKEYIKKRREKALRRGKKKERMK